MHNDKKKSMEVAKKPEKSFSELYKIKKVMICSYWGHSMGRTKLICQASHTL